MPVIKVESHRLDPERRKELIRGLTAVGARTMQVPERSFIVLLNELDDERIGIGGLDRGEAMKKA